MSRHFSQEALLVHSYPHLLTGGGTLARAPDIFFELYGSLNSRNPPTLYHVRQ